MSQQKNNTRERETEEKYWGKILINFLVLYLLRVMGIYLVSWKMFMPPLFLQQQHNGSAKSGDWISHENWSNTLARGKKARKNSPVQRVADFDRPCNDVINIYITISIDIFKTWNWSANSKCARDRWFFLSHIYFLSRFSHTAWRGSAAVFRHQVSSWSVMGPSRDGENCYFMLKTLSPGQNGKLNKSSHLIDARCTQTFSRSRQPFNI